MASKFCDDLGPAKIALLYRRFNRISKKTNSPSLYLILSLPNYTISIELGLSHPS